MWNLFKDKNDINEKNVIGFASFVVMVLFAVADSYFENSICTVFIKKYYICSD